MSIANRVYATLKCPRCSSEQEFEIEVELGHGGLLKEYRIGDEVEWDPWHDEEHGGRPKDGTIVKDGYVECEVCRKDFFVKVFVRHDRIEKVEVDESRTGYIP
jgi:DNA-directed RNA polymerase subunit RPC12/RpoP